MIIVMKTWCADNYNEANYDFAIFKLEVVEAKMLSQRFNLYKINQDSDQDLAEMAFNVQHCDELSCEFYPCEIWERDDKDVMPASIKEDIEKQGWSIVEELDPDITPRHAHAPDNLFLMLSKEGFSWKTCPPGMSLHVESEVLPFDIVARVL